MRVAGAHRSAALSRAGAAVPIRRRIATAAMLSALAVGLTAIPAPANSDRAVAEARCDGTRVAVLAAKASDRALICAGARDAVGFMKDQGLDVGVDVVVEVVTRLPDELSDSVVGCYVPSRKRVFMLPYAEFARHTDWFGLPIEPALYRSLASHEVAHAVSGCNFSVAKPSLAAWEYVAYVVMLSVMAPDLRDRLLAQIPGGGFESNEQIHSVIYELDPTLFAVKSYRHFLRPGNGREYLRAILSGKALVE